MKEEVKRKISIIIPCYRSEKTLETVVKEVIDVINTKQEFFYEIILVNDNSPDQVWNVIKKLVQENTNIVGISLTRNFGQHAALMAGFQKATGDIIVSVDDDGQIPVDELFFLIDKLDEGYDVVYGIYPKSKKKKLRVFGTWINNKMTEIMLDKPKGLCTTSFYAAKKFVIDEVLRYKNPYPYMTGLILRATKNIGTVQVNHRSRLYGKSGYHLKKLVALWINGFTAFSEKPLRIATYTGGICAIAGFIYGIITIIRKLINSNIQVGYSSLMAVVLFIGGALMILLGIIGEYIGRIYISVNNAPQFVIREMIGKDINEKNTYL